MIRSGYGITYHSHPWGAQALRGWYPLTLVAVFSGINGFQPVTTDPRLRRGGRPECTAGARLSGFHRSAALTSTQGRVPLPSVAETGYPVANQELHRGYIQSWNLIFERKLPATGRVDRIRRVGVCQRLRVPRHQRLADTGLRRRGTAALRAIRTHHRQPGSGMAARTASTTRCKPRSIGASQVACCSRVRTRSRRPSTRPPTPTGRSSAGTRRACSIATARWRTTISRTTSSLACVYELPFGTAKKWATSGTSATVLGGWQLNGLFAAYSGRPFNADRLRRLVEHAGQRRRRRTRSRTTSKSSATSAATGPTSTPPHLRGSPRFGSATWAATPCADPV